MFKKGGILLGMLLVSGLAIAQDSVADLFREDNPNLINLNEGKEYNGAPLVYIQGVKAPEQANNDMEELQLKLFGTKNVQEATKNTLELSENTPETAQNQEQEFVFKTPFNQTKKSVFVPHISDFMTMIQVLNQDQMMVTENIVLINTQEKQHWERKITLPEQTTATAVSYIQNGKSYPISEANQKNLFTFTATEPLKSGPNHLVFKYRLENPFTQNTWNMELVNQSSIWPIEKFNTLIMFPIPIQINESKLLFGNNKLEIPDIYTQQADKESTVNIRINRIVPPKASVQLQMQLETNKLPIKAQTNTGTWILILSALVTVLYWIAFGIWEKYQLKKTVLTKIKTPATITELAYQMGTHLSEIKWKQLIDFGINNQMRWAKVATEQKALKQNAYDHQLKASIKTTFCLLLEPLIGTVLIGIGATTALTLAQETPTLSYFILFGLFSLIGLTLLYQIGLKPTRREYWRRKLDQLSDKTTIIGLTAQQVRKIYPCFILMQKHEDWRTKLIKLNPKLAHETHLY